MHTRARVGILAALLGAILAAGCGDGAGGEDARPAASTVATRASDATGCPETTPTVRDVPYAEVPGADPARLRLDVYSAAHGCPAPVVVWVHGGGWQRGDKRNQMTDKVRLWNDAGYVVVSVNYRLTDPGATALVRYPAHDQDVGAAVAWVHDHIARYGGDPDRIALLGHSAGAQIAASVATDPRFLGADGLGLDALRCAGSLDTEGYDVAASAGTGNAIYRNAFGEDPAVWADASPIVHVTAGAGIPRFLVVERGTPRRRRAADEFVARLRGAGVPVTVVDGGSLSHAGVNAAVGRGGDAIVTPPLEAFLAECFSPTP